MNNADILKALSAGVDVNTADRCGFTPLHHLMLNADSSSNPLNVLNALLKHKANVKARDQWGRTPLHLLLRNRYLWKDTDILDALLSAGADVNAADKYDDTPLHHLMGNADTSYNCSHILNALLKHEANVKAINKWGWTPLHLLLKNVELWKDTDMNKTDKYGENNFNIRKAMNILFVLIAEGAYVCIAALHKPDSVSIETWKDILKLMIQCEILKFQKYFLNVVSEDDLVSVFMMLDVCRNKSALEAWCLSYVRDCISELLQMMKHTYGENFSLSRHLFNFFENKRQLKSFPSDIIDEVLDNIAQNCYPCYGNLIELLIHPHDFSDHLSLSICSEDNTELFLNSYCISAIAKFLPKNDLINLRQAAYRANEKRKL